MAGRAWRPITIVVVVLLVLAAVFAATFDPEQPSALVEGWSSATVQGADDAVMSDVVALTEGFLAVGHAREDGRYVPALWRSKSGHDWRRVDHDSFEVRSAGGDDAVMTTISTGQRTVVIGHEAGPSDDGPVAVWVSPDEGESWDRLPHDEEVFVDGQVRDVTTSSDGSWIAVGSRPTDDGRRPEVWRSPDGRVWELIAPSTSADSGDVDMHVVTTGGDGLVAMGSGGHGDEGSRAPVWTSSDGVTWRQVRVPVEVLGSSATIRDAIAWRQEGMLAAADEGPEDASRLTVLSRLDSQLDDGTAWKSANVSGGGVHGVGLLDAGDGHVFLVGWATEDGQPSLTAWTSKDGQSWEPVEAPGLDAPGVTPTAITTSGTNTVIVGSSADDTAVAFVHGKAG